MLKLLADICMTISATVTSNIVALVICSDADVVTYYAGCF